MLPASLLQPSFVEDSKRSMMKFQPSATLLFPFLFSCSTLDPRPNLCLFPSLSLSLSFSPHLLLPFLLRATFLYTGFLLSFLLSPPLFRSCYFSTADSLAGDQLKIRLFSRRWARAPPTVSRLVTARVERTQPLVTGDARRETRGNSWGLAV